MSTPQVNPFLTAPLGPLYVRTAVPIVFVMLMNGLLAVADALFLGHFVGPEALAAVTLMFPAYMILVALATLVASGLSSLLARHLGAGDLTAARAVFAGAHGLALLCAGALILLFALFGSWMSFRAAGGNAALADLGHVYLRIAVLFSPLAFILALQSDSLRNEGKAGVMAAMSLLVSTANIGFNYLLIAKLNWGVAGSAYGTALAQACALVLILGYRQSGRSPLTPSILLRQPLTAGWGRILALGAPQSLSFLGLSLGSTAILVALQWVSAAHYAETLSAYGIVTRVLTFCYLPLLGLCHAMQTITGHNYGARLWPRSDASLRTALLTALIYCGALQLGLTLFAGPIGAAFVTDPSVVAEVAHLLPIIVAMFTLAGPLMVIAMHFQAIGQAGRAALLALSKPYVFALPLTFALAARYGEWGIWLASPLGELALLLLTAGVLLRIRQRDRDRWGLFAAVEGRT